MQQNFDRGNTMVRQVLIRFLQRIYFDRKVTGASRMVLLYHSLAPGWNSVYILGERWKCSQINLLLSIDR